jgi:hypothetical protein
VKLSGRAFVTIAGWCLIVMGWGFAGLDCRAALAMTGVSSGGGIWWYRLTGALVIVPVLRVVAVFLTIMATALVGIALSLRSAGGLPRLAKSSGMTG